MLKRVVRRAIDARRNSRAEEPSTPTPAKATPKRPSSPPPSGGIAARLAAGQTNQGMPTVSATSGAQEQDYGGFQTAPDGTQFWGPTDNESSRAKARGEALVIDQWECISCGTCVENTDAVFTLPDDAKAVVTQQTGDMTLIQDAIDSCPVTCIHWSEEPQEFEQLNDADGNPL